MSLNRVSLIGHLGQDPELRYLPTSGQPVTGFSIATDESFTGKDGNRQERVEWHNIVVFGKLAETCAKYLSKGRQIYVEGRLQTREFESKNGGGKRQRAEIVAQRVQFLGPRPDAPMGGEAEEPAASEERSILRNLKRPAPESARASEHPPMTEAERKKRTKKLAVITERLVRTQLRAMGCDRFDLGIRRDAGEMILREATVSDVKLYRENREE